MGMNRAPWYLPLLLILPAFYPLAYECWRVLPNQIPTGFINTDGPSYIANAREHFDEGFHLTYGNPYASYDTPRVFFQPQTFLLALIVRTGLDPGIAYHLFGFLAQLFCAFVAVRLYEKLAGWQTAAQKIGLWCLFWGGGLLSLTGVEVGHFMGVDSAIASMALDPNEGWWMLNFGRNLTSPMEAYYHGVFLLAMLFLLEKRFAWVLALCALASISHPFTGISLAAVIVVYCALELLLKSGAVSWTLFAGSVSVAVLHVAYYLVFLNSIPEHRNMQSQWLLEWVYLPWTFGCALAIVGFLVFARFSRWDRLQPALQDTTTRLFFVWFAVIFALTQHQLVMKPIQPIHFAHGYDWIALFFLALPVLLDLLHNLLSIRQPVARIVAMGAFLLILFSDNLLWFRTFGKTQVQRYTISFSPDQKAVLSWVNTHAAPGSFVVSEDASLNYLTSTYTRLRAWYGHPLNTPYYRERLLEAQNVFLLGKAVRTDHPVYYIPSSTRNWKAPVGAEVVFQNDSYIVWQSESGKLLGRN